MDFPTAYVIRDSEFDSMVEDVYNHQFSVCADEEMGNDTAKYYQDITGKIDEWGEKNLAEFRETGDGSYMTRTFLEDLCRQKKITPGNYVITVCW